METQEKQKIKDMVLKNYELYQLQSSRLARLIKSPFKTIPFYILSLIARIHPFKISKKTLWGDTMSYYLPEGNMIYYYGFFEANLTNFLINILNDGDTFIDIGAHVGTYSMLASKLVGEHGSVYAFEPTPRTFETLKKNVSVYNQTEPVNMAMMDTPQTLEFMDYGPKNSVFNTFKDRTSGELKSILHGEKIKVNATSIDKFVELKNIQPNENRALVIKIDAEGAESIILNGGVKTLREIKPIVSIEVGSGEEWKKNNTDAINFLKNNSYQCFELSTEGYLHPHIQKEMYIYDNLIFIHTEKVSKYNEIIK